MASQNKKNKKLDESSILIKTLTEIATILIKSYEKKEKINLTRVLYFKKNGKIKELTKKVETRYR